MFIGLMHATHYLLPLKTGEVATSHSKIVAHLKTHLPFPLLALPLRNMIIC